MTSRSVRANIKLVALVATLLIVMWPAPMAQAETWSYEDDRGDAASVVDVFETDLNNNTKGFFIVRIYGKEFVKNETDVFVVYVDSYPDNNGPEFVYGSQIGNIPGDKKQGQALTKRSTPGMTPASLWAARRCRDR